MSNAYAISANMCITVIRHNLPKYNIILQSKISFTHTLPLHSAALHTTPLRCNRSFVSFSFSGNSIKRTRHTAVFRSITTTSFTTTFVRSSIISSVHSVSFIRFIHLLANLPGLYRNKQFLLILSAAIVLKKQLKKQTLLFYDPEEVQKQRIQRKL